VRPIRPYHWFPRITVRAERTVNSAQAYRSSEKLSARPASANQVRGTEPLRHRPRPRAAQPD